MRQLKEACGGGAGGDNLLRPQRVGLLLPNREGKGRLGVYRGDLGNATAEAACKPGVYPFWPFYL